MPLERLYDYSMPMEQSRERITIVRHSMKRSRKNSSDPNVFLMGEE